MDDDRAVVVLDDDPTGVQTIHDIMVTTQWDEDSLSIACRQGWGFFILTNSRSFPQEEAVRNASRDIARNLIKRHLHN